MKTPVMLIIFSLMIALTSAAGELIDILHLKNGDIVKGEIINDVPGEHLKIKLQNGEILGYMYSEIKQIDRDVPTGRDSEMERKLAEEEKLRKEYQFKYEQKSPCLASLFAYLIPSAGHYYARNWSRGLLFAAGRIGCAAYALSEVDFSNNDQDYSNGFYIAAGGAAFFMIMEIIDANWEAKRYNNRLYETIFGNPKLGLRPAPVKDGIGLTLSYQF
jgi:hypothetical protein